MAALLLNETLPLAAITSLTATSTTLPVPADQSPQWDAVAVYGFVFGLLAVLLAVPGTYLAIIALKKHRKHEARQWAINDIEPDIVTRTSGLENEGAEAVGVDRLDREAGG